jgi:tetratricopeptide (TPR) repeat protein
MLSSPNTRAPVESVPERVAGRYELIERIAQGGMGEVFVARELATGRKVALKRLLPAAQKRQALFRAEYHVLARLKHPFIIEVYEFGVDKELPYYTMELLDGYDLREAPHVALVEGCRILRDVACSLALLHGQRLLHRDVSPRNVRRTESGVCKLIDFGTMVPFGVPPNLAGTPPFISPEAWEGGLLDQRADLYSLGAVAYWLFSRRLPGNARTIDRASPPRERLPLLRKVAKDIPIELEELVMSLLEHDPNKRPSSANEVIARLSAIGGLPANDTQNLAGAHLGSSRFVGQKRALAKAEKLLKRSLVCNGGAVLVESGEGSGKTRLLQEVSLLAQTQGFSVVRAFASRSTTGSSVARELYRSLKRAAPEALELVPPPEREALAQLDRGELTAVHDQSAELRARLSWALGAFFRVVARQGPWLVVVDDLDLADEFSVAFVAALSAMAETLPLLVLGSACTLKSADSLSLVAFAQRAQRIELADLDEKRTRTLVSDLFGRVPNRERLVEFLYRGAHGNPAMTMELCRFLLERGVIRYVDGGFVLPDGEIREQLPARAALAFALRLQGLSGAAHELANLIATCRGGASLELCLLASEGSNEDVLSAVNELVSHGILMGSGQEYVFAHEAVRNALRMALTPEHTRELHERLSSAFATLDQHAPLRKLEAAFHLVHTAREREGAERLAELAPPLIEAGVARQDAIEGLEKALEVLERLRAPLELSLTIRTHLARASYTYDYRLADRYAEKTIEDLRAWSGMRAVEKIRRFLPAPCAALLCIAIMCYRRLFWSKARRGPSAILTLKYLGRVVVSTLGVRLTALDRAATARMLDLLWIFRELSRVGAVGAVYHAAEALALQPYGREAALCTKLTFASRLIALPVPMMQEPERQDLRVGLLLSGGINECYRLGSKALSLAEELSALGTRIAQASAHRIRFTYFVVRGMREKAEEYRRELDVHGLSGGTTWQVEWFAVPTEGMASALLGDLVGTAQALSRLERLAAEIPSLVLLRDMVKVGYLMRRGEHAQAIALGEAFVAQHAPGSVIGWGTVYSALAASLNYCQRYAEARKLCETALAGLQPGDVDYVIMYGPLVRELGVACAGTGDAERALEIADEYVLRLEGAGEFALLAHAHECRARVARMIGNQELLMNALIAMRDAADRAASATVIQQAAKVTQASLRATHEFAKHETLEEAQESMSSSSSEATPPGGIARTRRRTLLRRVLERAKASSGLVLALSDNDGVPRIAAAAGEPVPFAEMLAAVLPLLAQIEDAPDAGEEHEGRLEIEGRKFALVTLPREHGRQSPIVLLLEQSDEASQTVPLTLLTRLAEGVRSELSLSPESSDSVPDSDISETFS